jgi:hypothetical protein
MVKLLRRLKELEPQISYPFLNFAVYESEPEALHFILPVAGAARIFPETSGTL